MRGFQTVARIWRRVLALCRRDRLEDELAEEIQLHLEMRRQAFVDTGMDAREADAMARRRFGNVLAFREEARGMWGFTALDAVFQDLRYALRLLRRAPWFTAVAVISLAAGIGSATTMFAVADAVLWRVLPVPAPEELHEFGATISLGAGAKHVGGVDAATLEHVRQHFDAGRLLGFQVVDDVAFGEGEASTAGRPRAECVTDDYFRVLGIRAVAGRLLTGGDGRTQPVPVVISERLWAAAFQRDPAVLDRVLTVNGAAAVVVGVAAVFRGVVADRAADLFVPLGSATVLDPRLASQPVRLLARVPKHVSPSVAEQKLAAVLRNAGPSMMRAGELRVRLTPAPGGVADARAAMARPVTIGFLLSAVLLIVSCANTGGLLVARFAARQGEFGLRAAIGASRMRLVAQLVIEAVLLSALAATAGLLLAHAVAPLLMRQFPVASGPAGFELRFDFRVVTFTAAAAALAAFISGGASLARVVWGQPAGVLATSTRTVVPGPRRMTRVLVALQVAASLLLVVGAASMTRTLLHLRNVDPGFDPDGAFAVRVEASAIARDPAAMTQYFRALHEQLAAVPGVDGLSLAQFGFMTSAATTGTVDVRGFVPATDADRWVRVFWVGPTFFETLRIPLLTGRDIGLPDLAARERIAIVNEQFARFYFGSPERALGQIVNNDVRIIGVAADAHYDTLRDAPARAIFTPFTQSPPRPAMTFIVRPRGGSQAALAPVLEELRRHEPRLRVQVTSLPDQVRSTVNRERFLAAVALVLSGIGVFLSCAGLFAAVSYATAQRRAELAIRVALGASRRSVIRLVLREPVGVAAAGVAIGLPGAYFVMRIAASLLYGIDPFDLPTVAAAALVLIAACGAAAFWPAMRAGRVDPLIALRAQ